MIKNEKDFNYYSQRLEILFFDYLHTFSISAIQM